MQQEKEHAQRPNVLLICTDHWPASLMGIAGHPCILTPTLDQFARNGVRFVNAYSATPVCVPARRALMTGMTAEHHGCRQNSTLEMPDAPTIASTFGDAGYQTYAVGKLHVTPQRDRIGFDDVMLLEEGRHQPGMTTDDYEQYLTESGHHGQQFAHGMGNNDYGARAWHLPEAAHPTNWSARELCRFIKRRDPKRPGFWYLSFQQPHPPLMPLQHYFDLYSDTEIPEPYVGEWARDFDALPHALKAPRTQWDRLSAVERKRATQAFYAQCTHIDQQIRLVIGTLREEGLLDNTIICFTSDHGDMLGQHGLCRKSIFYQDSANVPLIIVPPAEHSSLGHNVEDQRLVELRDVMPTLLDLAGIPIPDTVDGISLAGDNARSTLFGECGGRGNATRMIRDERHKLIYYPVGNRIQLFDLVSDPHELHDVADDRAYADTKKSLTQALIDELYGSDRDWVRNGALVGEPERPFSPGLDRGLSGQRGLHFY